MKKSMDEVAGLVKPEGADKLAEFDKPAESDKLAEFDKNVQIAEYYKYALMGVIAADQSSRLPEIVCRRAMEFAQAAYKEQVATLGEW